jgi:rubredoxin
MSVGSGMVSSMSGETSVDPDDTRCPACGSDARLEIHYGFPAGPPGPGVALGGCLVGPDMKSWQCGVCGQQWGDVFWESPDVSPTDRA